MALIDLVQLCLHTKSVLGEPAATCQSDKIGSKMTNLVANNAGGTKRAMKAMNKSNSLGIFFTEIKAKTDLSYIPPNWSAGLPATVRLWQTNERPICNGMNGMNDFENAPPVEVLDANTLMPFESF